MTNTATTPQKNVVELFYGSEMFDRAETDLNISPDYVQARLAWHYEDGNTTEKLWGKIILQGVASWYELDYVGIKLNEIKN